MSPKHQTHFFGWLKGFFRVFNIRDCLNISVLFQNHPCQSLIFNRNSFFFWEQTSSSFWSAVYLLFWSVALCLHWFTDAVHQEMELHELFQWCWAVSFYEPSKVACKWRKRPGSCFAGHRRKLSATSVFNMLPPFLNGNCYCSWRRVFKRFFAHPK